MSASKTDALPLGDTPGKMAEGFKAADCKSADFYHRRFKSYSSQTGTQCNIKSSTLYESFLDHECAEDQMLVR